MRRNRLTQTSSVLGLPSTVNYQYDIAHRATNVNGITYTFDNNGNLLSDGVNQYQYDSANRLKTMTSGSVAASYSYNGLGDRLQQTVNETTNTFTMDLNTGLTQALSDGTNTYIYGVDRIAQIQGGTTEYFLNDALGSVRQMTDANAQITYARAYDPYGVVTSMSGSSQSAYGYTGEYMGDSTQLVYLRARYYSPTIGRFQTQDTWGGDENHPLTLNAWNYTSSNPINYSDPSGHCQNPDGSWTWYKLPWFGPCRQPTTVSGNSTATPLPTPTSTPTRVFPPTFIPTATSLFSYNPDLAVNFALDHIASLNGLLDFGNNCANLVSRALGAGGLIDPSGLWNPSDLTNAPAIRAGNASEYDLFDFLSTYFRVEIFNVQPGIRLRGNTGWESWIAAQSNRVRKGDVVFYTWDDGIIHNYWDHVALVVSTNQPETTLFSNATGNYKPKVVEQSGSLNNYCWPIQNPPDPGQHPECGFGIYASSAGRSIDDAQSKIAALAIVFMQEPK